jgi:hypothetical protein
LSTIRGLPACGRPALGTFVGSQVVSRPQGLTSFTVRNIGMRCHLA